VFNLTGKRYLFLIISLIVIIPGTLSLIFKGLNVGIDFLGGANIELRPEQSISIAQTKNLVQPFKLVDLQVVSGDNPQVAGNQTIWIRLNTQVDSNVQNTIKNDLHAKYDQSGKPAIAINIDDLSLVPSPGAKPRTVTVFTVTKFPGTPPTPSAVRSLLSKLPNTSDPTKGPSTSTATTPTATGTATGTASATATPKATRTPSVLVTPTATPSSATNPANIRVNVVDVRQGTTTETITLLTRSTIDNGTLLQLQSHFVNSGIYMQVLQNATVSGSVAGETTRNAILAVIAASVLILLYVWFAFRKVAKPWRYGTCAIIALLHDVLVVVGVFSILGWLFGVQIDALFITALLTVVGFSVHDTIVVFDRIRENMTRRTSETFEQVVNASLVQTMARSLNTSLTVLFTLSALTLFGGESIRVFTGALLLGILSGTYSSIFNASMLLVIWERGELGLGRFNRDRTQTGREARELVRSRG
jgi:preprotein translocase SecF subunit